MDPNFQCEERGLVQDRGRSDDNAAYLRRLKAQQVESAPRTGADPDTSLISPQCNPVIKERRQSRRYACSGSVEFKVEGSAVRMWGTVTDISQHGCYVEMSTTFPVNTKASLVLDSVGVRFHTQATVRASYPFLGMGMCFTEMEAAQRSQLEQILATLAGAKAIPNGAASEQTASRQTGFEQLDPDEIGRQQIAFGEPSLAEVLAFVDPWVCLEEISQFFKKNTVLSRDELYDIAKRVRRS